MKTVATTLGILIGFTALLIFFSPAFMGNNCCAQGTAILSNLKQINTCLQIYLGDSDDMVPPDVLRVVGEDRTMAIQFKSVLQPYLRNDMLWVFTPDGRQPTDAPRIGMDGRLSSFCTSGDFWLDHKIKDSMQVGANLAKEPNPELKDILRENLFVNPTDQDLAGHGGSIAVSYVDGHTRRVKVEEYVAKAKVL